MTTNNNNNVNETTSEATHTDAAEPASDSAVADGAVSGGAAFVAPRTLGEAAANATSVYSFRASYLMLAPHYAQMPADKLPPVTLNVNKIIVLGMGVLPEVEKLRAAIQDELPRLPPDLIEQVRHALFGLAHSNILRQVAAAGGPSKGANDAADPLRLVRGYLVSDVTPLVSRRIVTPEAIGLTPGNSPRNVAFDVLRLVEVADSHYHHLEGQSKTTRADLQAAAKAAQDLLEELGAREQSTESVEETTLMRLRALAYFIALYEELRWAVRYVRRHYKDAKTIMPSLFTLRKKRATSAAADDDEDEPATEEPSEPATATDEDIDLAHLQALMNGGAQPAAATHSPTTAATATNGSNTGGSSAR